MGGAISDDPIVRFGPHEIDRQARELRRDGERIPLRTQPFRLLEALVACAGRGRGVASVAQGCQSGSQPFVMTVPRALPSALTQDTS
jgi:hypothetical protein